MMDEDKTKDYFQAAFSIWIILLGLLYFAYPDNFWNFFLPSLIAWLLVLGLYAVIRKRKFGYIFRSLYDKNVMQKIGKMSAYEFEDLVAALYTQLGYRAERVSGSEFGGIDVFISGVGGEYYLVCKNRIGSLVGKAEAEEFYQALLRHRTKGKMITSGYFDSEATDFAGSKEIELIDSKALIKLIRGVGDKIEIK